LVGADKFPGPILRFLACGLAVRIILIKKSIFGETRLNKRQFSILFNKEVALNSKKSIFWRNSPK
jgi:hypothetical protein